MLKNAGCSILALGLTAILSGGCAELQQSLAPRAKTPHTLGCRLASYGKFPDLALAQLPELGVKYVEIPVPPADQIEAVGKRFQDHGLSIIMLIGKTDLSKPGCVEELMVQLRTCREMGVRFMFLSAKTNGAPRDVVCERLWKAGEFARTQQVTIVLETHPDLMTNGTLARETMRKIHHPNVRMNFDTGNIYYYNQDTTAHAELAKVIEYVATVHLKDTDGGYQSWNFPALGKGVVDFKAVIKKLDENGFTGPFIMELEGTKGVEMDEAQTRAYVADSVAYLRSIAEFR